MPENQSEGSDEEPGETTSIQSRYWLTNDLMLGLLNLSFIAVLASGAASWLDLQSVPGVYHVTFVMIVGTANVWAFGPAALEAWNDAKVLEGGESE